jgi:hypothetical protein
VRRWNERSRGAGPWSQQDIVAEAIGEWLSHHANKLTFALHAARRAEGRRLQSIDKQEKSTFRNLAETRSL